ncbi:hypothetical protein AB0H04_32060 [Streptomyces flaveolus]|uniref:Uncharacterized protein n=1 Tax=Streptomyces flaveolus TaxID=67297 RepID=A0ABV3AHL7_9ACTN|nr:MULTISPECIES: hypothetical protein [Streptomyces]
MTLDRGHTRDALAGDIGPTAWLRAVADRFPPVSGLQADQIEEPSARPVAGELRDALRKLAAEATNDPRPSSS